MTRRLIALAALLLVTAAAPPPAKKIGLHITLSTAGDHLRAHFHTDEPVADIIMDDRQTAEIEDQVRPVRLRRWSPVGRGWLPYDGRLARRDHTPFQDADLDLYPDDLPISRADPMVFPAGGGFVLHSRYLLADQKRFNTTLDIAPRKGEFFDMGAPGLANLVQHDFTREMYLGPAASLTGESGARLIAGPDIPARLRARIVAGVARSLAFYRERLGVAVPWEPTLIVAQLPEAIDQTHTSSEGKVAPGGVMTVRFFGPDMQSGSEWALAALDFMVAHEAFHFWDASLANLRNGGESPWLYEGGADYASLLERRAAGLLDDAAWYREFDRTLLTCRRQLGARGLGQVSGFERYRLAYPCGFVIQWICDMAIQHASHQQSGVFDLWHDLLIRAKRQGGYYDMEDFRSLLAAADPAALAMVDLLLAPEASGRWDALRRQMEAYGVETATALQPEHEVRLALIRHLISIDCSDAGPWRMSEGVAGLRVSLERKTCRHLGAAADIRAVEGFSLFSATYSAHAAALRKCALGQTVDLTLGEGQSIGIVCTRPLAPLAEAPPDFVVLGMP